MEVETKIRKWGNGYGILLPKSFVNGEAFSENEFVVVNISSRKKDIRKLRGLCKFNRSTEEIMKEIRDGYDD